jgi:putative Ca2+/H+ antiporter (TMEM165/GDT1 family)
MPTRISKLIDRFRFRREPVWYIAAGGGAVITAARVLSGESLTEIFSEDWFEYLFGVLLAYATRMSVSSPDTVDRLVRDLEGDDA